MTSTEDQVKAALSTIDRHEGTLRTKYCELLQQVHDYTRVLHDGYGHGGPTFQSCPAALCRESMQLLEGHAAEYREHVKPVMDEVGVVTRYGS